MTDVLERRHADIRLYSSEDTDAIIDSGDEILLHLRNVPAEKTRPRALQIQPATACDPPQPAWCAYVGRPELQKITFIEHPEAGYHIKVYISWCLNFRKTEDDAKEPQIKMDADNFWHTSGAHGDTLNDWLWHGDFPAL